MIVVIILGLLSVFVNLLKFKNPETGLKISFGFIFLFLGLRYNFGRDYESYFRGFIEINKYRSINLRDYGSVLEPSWFILCRICKPIGFFGLTILLAIFNSVVYYLFIKRFVPYRLYWLAILLYVFSEGLMIVQSSAIRQTIAINIFFISIFYLQKKAFLKYVACIFLASTFHISALILSPIYLFLIPKWRISKKVGIILFVVYVSLFIFGSLLLPNINEFIANYFPRYSEYTLIEGDQQYGSGIGILFSSFVLLLILRLEKYQNNDSSILFKIAFLNYIIIALSMVSPMIGRVGMYFQPILIVAVYPLLVTSIKVKQIKIAFILLILLYTGFNFVRFFNTPYLFKYYGVYQTFFSASSWY